MIPRAYLSRLSRRPLRVGDADTQDVRRWRARLRAKGFEVAEHGAFDKPLHSATVVAQHWAGVTADGLVGPATWRAVGRKQRTRHPVTVIRNKVAARPKIIDARNGKAGFPRGRRSWGKRSRSSIKAILGHYTGGPASFLADAHFHVDTDYLAAGGAPAIAYHLGVDRDGTVYVFNDFDSVTWHCDGGHNTDTLGIVFRGGAEGPSTAQRKSLEWLVRALAHGTLGYSYPEMPDVLTTHRHVNATSCPGELGEAFYRATARKLGLAFKTSL